MIFNLITRVNAKNARQFTTGSRFSFTKIIFLKCEMINLFLSSFSVCVSDTRFFSFHGYSDIHTGMVKPSNQSSTISFGSCDDKEDVKLNKFKVIHKNAVTSCNRVLSITDRWGPAIYHYPVMLLTQFAYFNTTDWTHFDCLQIVKDEGNIWHKMWLNLMYETFIIPKNMRIVSKPVFGKVSKILHPFTCGGPSTCSLNFMNDILSPYKLLERNSIVYVLRTRSHTINNSYLHAVKDFGNRHNALVKIFNDSKLPTLKDQIQLFSSARLVIGAHGAGFTIPSLICNPRTGLIEIMTTRTNMCYVGMSEKMKRTHVVVKSVQELESALVSKKIVQCME